MERSFWSSRWQEGKVGLHEDAPNRFLVEHAGWFSDRRRIYVPLCGKSPDLAWLAGRGHDVVGVEIVEDIVKQFFDEHGIVPEIETTGNLVTYRAGAITVIAGDYFDVTHDQLGPIDGVFDRAAMVALDADTRARYAAHLRTLSSETTRLMLVSIEFPPQPSPGPPFSVDEAEVRRLFAGSSVSVIGSGFDPQGRLGGQMFERCYAIENRQ